MSTLYYIQSTKITLVLDINIPLFIYLYLLLSFSVTYQVVQYFKIYYFDYSRMEESDTALMIMIHTCAIAKIEASLHPHAISFSLLLSRQSFLP